MLLFSTRLGSCLWDKNKWASEISLTLPQEFKVGEQVVSGLQRIKGSVKQWVHSTYTGHEMIP